MGTNKKQYFYRTIMLILLSIMITFLITASYFESKSNQKYFLQLSNENTKLQQKIDLVNNTISKYYIGDINEEKLVESSIKGYVDGLGDKYTEYMSKEEWKELETAVMGNYVGIGIYMAETKSEEVIIIAIIKNSPAEEAKLRPGDIILKVDNEECTGKDLTLISNKIKGNKNTDVQLEIKREEEILDLKIQRRNIKINNIETKVLNNNIGYMQMLSFDNGSAKEFEEKFLELKEKNIKSLIIDIRDNTGGIVQEALTIADFIVKKGNTLLITKDKNETKEVLKAENETIIDMEIVLLINENSASASEILAAALKENNEATLIGTKTFGKGVMQQVLEFTDGSAIKITTNEFYTPTEEKINELGIEPNIQIEAEDEKDTQLEKAIETLNK